MGWTAQKSTILCYDGLSFSKDQLENRLLTRRTERNTKLLLVIAAQQ